jgi:hypothetical protein
LGRRRRMRTGMNGGINDAREEDAQERYRFELLGYLFRKVTFKYHKSLHSWIRE